MTICKARPGRVLMVSPRDGALEERPQWAMLPNFTAMMRWWRRGHSVRADCLRQSLEKHGIRGYLHAIEHARRYTQVRERTEAKV